MPTIARIIGGAGTGKTAELMRLLSLQIEQGIDPFEVGFVSFTRAARREAATRAAELTGGSAEQLEQDAWFRTLHSVCFRCLGSRRDGMLAGDRKSTRWITDALQQEIDKSLGDSLDEDADFEAATDAGLALQLWSAARNRLEPLQVAWERAERCSSRTPPYETIADIVARYEQAKRLDDRSDFTDLLGRFAGWHFDVDGQRPCRPEGETPNLPVWFFDEQQDTSALLDAVCHRLIESSQWVYVVGDPFQAIYSWAGADASLFMKWPADKERTLPQSYRCPRPVHELGEAILCEASDYWDRGIRPANHEGSVEIERYTTGLLDCVEESDSWLILARTNWLANKLATQLTRRGIPWRPTRGQGGWPRKSRVEAICTLAALAIGEEISGKTWMQLIKCLPSKAGDVELLTRGTKSAWQENNQKWKWRTASIVDIEDFGASRELVAKIKSHQFADLIEQGQECLDAATEHGEDALRNPRVRVGTIHSAKGAEADNVLWLTTTTAAVSRGCEDQAGYDEECRCSYVAATRARRRLIVAVEPNQRHRFKVPA